MSNSTRDQIVVAGNIQSRTVVVRSEVARALHLMSERYTGTAKACCRAVKRLRLALRALAITNRPAAMADIDSMFAWHPVRRSPVLVRVS